MSEEFQEDLKFDAAGDAAEDGEGLIVDIDGFEGPLHLLLELARQQKVDLARVSILNLAEQYLQFIKNAQDLRIELAADYLVMASWLAYLKSRLILPKPEEEAQLEEPDELAAYLAFRLQRLEGMRRAVDGLLRLPQMGEQVHMRGQPEGLRSRTTPLWDATLFDILHAYGDSRSKATFRAMKVPKPAVLSLEDARVRLRRAMLDGVDNPEEWVALDGLLPTGDELNDDIPTESVKASSLLAGLVLAKTGEIEIRQNKTFAPIYIRSAQQRDPS